MIFTLTLISLMPCHVERVKENETISYILIIKVYHYVKIRGWGGKFTLVPLKPYVKGKSMYIMWAFNVEKFQD